MPLYELACKTCQTARDYYVPATAGRPQDAARDIACDACEDHALEYTGLGVFAVSAPLPTGAYDKQGRFYRGNFGGGQAALPNKKLIKRFP